MDAIIVEVQERRCCRLSSRFSSCAWLRWNISCRARVPPSHSIPFQRLTA